jgi:predicted RNase H-like nuclease
MWVAGVDGCRSGWVEFKVDLETLTTSVELVELVDLGALLRKRPPNLAYLAIDIPIGLMDGSRACDKAARKLLGRPRGSSVFPVPCRAAIQATNYDDATASNKERTGTQLSVWTWGIVPKIKEVDDAITPECQQWAFEVHPEVCFWALDEGHPLAHRKKIEDGVNERLDLLRPVFTEIDRHLQDRPSGVAKDDVLDAAVAAWTAIRISNGEARRVCEPERDDRGLEVAIWY